MLNADTLEFLADLKANNERDWFQANKDRYARAFKNPARNFCDALSHELERRHGVGTRAKVFRINRDLRFTKDKTPYNTHLHISVTEAEGVCAWMFGLEPGKLTLGYGCFAFPGASLSAFREGVDRDGQQLAQILSGLRVQAPELKRVPAPFPQDHPQGEMLRRKGLCAWLDDVPIESCFGPQGAGQIVERLAVFDALRDWLGRTL